MATNTTDGRVLRALPAQATAADDQPDGVATPLYDGKKLIGVAVGSRVYPVDSDDQFAPALDDQGFATAAARALRQSQKQYRKDARKLRQQVHRDLDRDHQGLALGWIRAGVAKWQYDVDIYRPDRTQTLRRTSEALGQLHEMRAQMVTNAAAALGERHRRQLAQPFEAEDEQRRREEALFETGLSLTEKRETQAHELALARLAQEAQTAEADKQREHELTQQTIELATQLPAIIEEVKLAAKDYPPELVKEALDTLQTAMTMTAPLLSELNPKEQEAMAKMLRPVINRAVNMALQMVGSRHG